MKSNELDALIEDCLEGRLSEADAARLSAELQNSPDARARYWDLASVHGLLEYAMEQASLRVITGQDLPATPKLNRWFSWRPLAAAAAGIVFGMLCTSVLFGYMMPRAVATAARLFALVDGSFEKQHGRLPSGFPVEFGVWSGDESEIVRADSAKDGKQALRFVRAEGDAYVLNSPANSCDVWQLVDLRGLKAESADGEATLELSAAFLDARKSRDKHVLFSVRVYAFAGDPTQLRAEWPMAIKDALAFGSGVADSWGGTPRTWRSATAKMMLPGEADFAVVHLVATKGAPHGEAAEFGEQFADDVRLTLKTQPALPVRVATR